MPRYVTGDLFVDYTIKSRQGTSRVALAALVALRPWRRPSRLVWPLAGLALAIAGHLVYNLARFHDASQTGYGAQASVSAFSTPLLLRIDTLDELEYFKNGGILPYVLRQLAP